MIKIISSLKSYIAERYDKHEHWSLLGVLFLFSTLALANATRWSIWFDEAFSAYLMRFNIVDLTRYTAADVHPPFYYWLLKGWTSIFGSSELAFRSMSILAAIVALVGAYFLIRKLFNRHAAIVAVFFASLTPLFLRFADEARMYTLVVAIVIWATWLLVRLQEKSSRIGWIGYGILLAAGMYTHYFAAFAWLAHWAWRYSEKRRGKIKTFWTREWILAHLLAVGLYLPWLMPLYKQFTAVQEGFWIPAISAYSPVDYLSNSLIYQQYGAVNNWWMVLFMVLLGFGASVLWRARNYVAKKHRSGYNLLVCMTIVPPVLLALFSLPPLKSSFLDRYVLSSVVFLVLLLAFSIYLLWNKQRRLAFLASLALIGSMGAGIYNVYYYGNYNKNSNYSIRVREAVDLVHKYGQSSQPIIASSPWLYYEASFYDSKEHHVYFMEGSTKYEYGSLAMLKESDMGKIKNINDFTERHRYVWYLDTRVDSPIEAPVKSWKEVMKKSVYDSINNNHAYHVVLFDTQSNAE